MMSSVTAVTVRINYCCGYYDHHTACTAACPLMCGWVKDRIILHQTVGYGRIPTSAPPLPFPLCMPSLAFSNRNKSVCFRGGTARNRRRSLLTWLLSGTKWPSSMGGGSSRFGLHVRWIDVGEGGERSRKGQWRN